MSFLYPLLKFVTVIFLIFFLIFLALIAIGLVIRYFYSRRISGIGNRFVKLGTHNQPMELYELTTAEAKKTISFQEIVFLCSKMHINLGNDPIKTWKRTQRIGREAILEGSFVGKDDRHYILTLHLRRKHQRWRVSSFNFVEDKSRTIRPE